MSREIHEKCELQEVYKLHGIDTVLGYSKSSNTQKFYFSQAEALEAAKSYVSRSGDPCQGIVIFKAVLLVEPQQVPITVTTLGGF